MASGSDSDLDVRHRSGSEFREEELSESNEETNTNAISEREVGQKDGRHASRRIVWCMLCEEGSDADAGAATGAMSSWQAQRIRPRSESPAACFVLPGRCHEATETLGGHDNQQRLRRGACSSSVPCPVACCAVSLGSSDLDPGAVGHAGQQATRRT